MTHTKRKRTYKKNDRMSNLRSFYRKRHLHGDSLSTTFQKKPAEKLLLVEKYILGFFISCNDITALNS